MGTLIYPLPTNEFVGYGTCPSYYFPMNEFMGWDIPFAGRTGTNEFVPYNLRHQNTYIPNTTHDFNHGISAPNNDPLTTHDFSRGTINPYRKSKPTHEFIRGFQEATC
ncbi:MAG: hypothetical protein WC611_04245 [Candidatus Neomarinimicrobiota bacterium]|jgi:hypothetical protein